VRVVREMGEELPGQANGVPLGSAVLAAHDEHCPGAAPHLVHGEGPPCLTVSDNLPRLPRDRRVQRGDAEGTRERYQGSEPVQSAPSLGT
jgi:hypothetical protein